VFHDQSESFGSWQGVDGLLSDGASKARLIEGPAGRQGRPTGLVMLDNARGRLPGKPLAIVDIGSNSVRLVSYESQSRAPTPTFNEKALCGLGRGVATTGLLPEDGVLKALAALQRFRVLCDTMRINDVRSVATAAVRDAANGSQFLDRAEGALGHKIELLNGQREARLSALGVISSIYKADGVVGDLGGGSLELTDVR